MPPPATDSRHWLCLRSGLCPPAYNMALDEALLLAMPQLAQPVLRVYGWQLPAATFGYFQKFADIEKATPLRPLIRRPTGGGLVPHDADWTYSVAIPTTHPWYALRAPQSYARLHRWLQLAFTRLSIATELAPCCRKEIPGQCFAGYEQHDVILNGRKIAGAAQRRTKGGLLIQGSVQPPPRGLAREAWEQAMRESATVEWGAAWESPTLPDWLEQSAQQLAREKYGRDEFNRRR